MIYAFLNFAIDLLNLLLLNMLLNIALWQQFSLNILRSAVCKHHCHPVQKWRKLGGQRSVTDVPRYLGTIGGSQWACARSGITYIILNGSWTPWHFWKYASEPLGVISASIPKEILFQVVHLSRVYRHQQGEENGMSIICQWLLRALAAMKW